ncbi:unnamed protein product [Zymoseptoria tritici ST99CH_3D7]|uniref:Uncharacterized protein n=1 Tax=Zymoseptoria tritici (strain ST99CH_3D7) TaxID=1276538 RepID=A0A1X7RH09_ZYMT9|nr:unnamed protein product [Zymoseptoria tritici ST99CH_3D7]
MADPITALGTAAAAFQVGKMTMELCTYLWKLGRAASKVEETVANLAAESSALSQACDLIGQEIKAVLPAQGGESASQYDEHGFLWKSINLQLVETQSTVGDLQRIVGEDGQDNLDFFQKARRQMYLDRNKSELDTIHRRLHTHTQSLQMALQMVNIKIAYLVPKIVSDDLGVKVEDLKRGIQELQLEYRANGKKVITPSEVELIQCAKDIMRSGKTLCEESSAGDYMQGGETSARINRSVTEWASDVELIRRDTWRSGFSETDTRAPSVFSDAHMPSDKPASTFTARTTAPDEDGEEQSRREIEDTDDMDDDFVLEIAQAALEQGQQAFEQKDWREAETLLKEALTDLKSLAPRRRSGFDIFELEYSLTVCAYHTREPPVAKEALMSLVGQTPASDEQKARIYDAAHLLAQLHLRENELEPARMTCESTLRARSKLLGKSHDSYLESLALLSQVYLLLGNAPRAKIFMNMIPDTRRSALRASLHILPSAAPTVGSGDASASSAADVRSLHSIEPMASEVGTLEVLPVPSVERSYTGTTMVSGQLVSGPSNLTSSQNMSPKEALEVPLSPRSRITEVYTEEGGTKSSPAVTMNAGHEPSEIQLTPAIADKASRKAILLALDRQAKGKLERAICESELQVALALAVKADDERRKSNPLALCYAACFGDKGIAEVLIQNGWDVNARDSMNGVAHFPLLLAMAARRPAMVQLLLENGAELALEPSKQDKVWISPAGAVLSDRWLAIRPAKDSSELTACISLALDAGWNVDRGLDEENQKSLLWQAVTCRPMESRIRCALVDFLLQKGSSPLKRVQPYTMVAWAIEKDCPEVLPSLLKQHTEQQLLERCDWLSAENALCRAVRLTATSPGRSLGCVTALLKAGANVHSKNEVEQKCLPEAMRNRSRLKKLVRTDSWRTVSPMEIAMASGHAGLKRTLEQYDTPRGFPARPGR